LNPFAASPLPRALCRIQGVNLPWTANRYKITGFAKIRAPMRIRNRLLILVLSLLVPALIASALAVLYVYAEEEKAQERSLTEAARTFSLLVEKELRAREAILLALANSPALARGDLAEFYVHAKSMATTPETTIILANPDGKQLLNTRLPMGAELPTRRSSNLAALIQQYGPENTLVSDVFLAPVAHRYDFTVQVPVRDHGVIRRFLVMGINASTLQTLLARQDFPKQWIATILDRKGVVVSRTRSPEQFVGTAVREYTRQVFAASRQGVFSSVTLDGIPVKAFYNRVSNADWTVLISIPESEIRRVSTEAATILAVVMISLLGFAFVAARWIARQAIKPIELLGETAEQLGRGEEVNYRPQGLLEVDSVGARITDASLQIKRSQQELEHRVAEAVATTERAQRALVQGQKLEALGRLTGGIAHEFNNLLQTLSTALQLAAMTSDQNRTRSLIATAEKAVDRATHLTSQLSAFGRIQDSRLSTVRLRDQVNNFEDLVKNILPSNVGLTIHMPESLWDITVDSLQLDLAFLNLAINAKDAMPQGGTIKLEASNVVLADPPDDLPPGDYIRICMSDTGSGMAPGVLAKALDPFFTTKGVGMGTGLGLPQAYGFARQSKGTLVLRRVEGEGTRVEIYLPKALEVATASVPAPPPQLLQSVGPRANVVFVEDDPLVREAMVPAIEQAGFSVMVATTGEDALTILQSGQSIDVVFSDIVMPGQVSGIQLAHAIREHFPAIRVILATGYSDQRIAMPGVALLAKPYRLEEAVNALRDATVVGA
jgi:signal transduction histidine kinase